MPTFYDKLLQVPILNLSIKWIDRAAHSRMLRPFDPAALGRSLAPRQRHLAYISIWAIVFAGMSAAQGVGDSHRGQWLPFWRQACDDERAYACPYLADLQVSFCDQGSGWACNEAGILHIALSQSGEDQRRVDPADAAVPFTRGCSLEFAAACQNLRTMTRGVGAFAKAPPTLQDYPIVLRGSKGAITDRDPPALYARACHEGWSDTCGSAAAGEGQ
jgi:hypothetical protein